MVEHRGLSVFGFAHYLDPASKVGIQMIFDIKLTLSESAIFPRFFLIRSSSQWENLPILISETKTMFIVV